ncbi:hypothetical protein EFK50_21280 [Nocardioides marmoriginsengisoli]|uniref:Uncharacterized protein n=1 Tax=Nocardioides marmoriginsengisoli TaxID=661483 RepID=A0A3N0C9R4_9ACTN|nr:hypothetical protein [Nocardioides marmoriginsengisoli]RNL60212.1 hypothetical protein EFK50_21280 [Nocardioides marmoriginsengisoli]
MSARVLICDTSSKPGAMRSPDRRRFDHDETCQAHGFLSLLNAQYFKRIGMCLCDVPMDDRMPTAAPETSEEKNHG